MGELDAEWILHEWRVEGGTVYKYVGVVAAQVQWWTFNDIANPASFGGHGGVGAPLEVFLRGEFEHESPPPGMHLQIREHIRRYRAQFCAPLPDGAPESCARLPVGGRVSCYEDGILVGTCAPVAVDDGAQLLTDGQLRGCGRLACEDCGEPVRQHVLEADAERRLYACACATHAERGARTVLDPWGWSMGRRPSWRCQGHDARALPAGAYGPDTDWRAELRARIASESAGGANRVWSSPLSSLAERLWSGPLSGAFALAMGDLLLDDDPRVRAEVASLFARRPTAAGAERIVSALRDHPELYTDIGYLPSQSPISAWLERALASRIYLVAGHEERALARERVCGAATVASTLLTAMFSTAPEWMFEHVEMAWRARPRAEALSLWLRATDLACPQPCRDDSRRAALLEQLLTQVQVPMEILRAAAKGTSFEWDLKRRP